MTHNMLLLLLMLMLLSIAQILCVKEGLDYTKLHGSQPGVSRYLHVMQRNKALKSTSSEAFKIGPLRPAHDALRSGQGYDKWEKAMLWKGPTSRALNTFQPNPYANQQEKALDRIAAHFGY